MPHRSIAPAAIAPGGAGPGRRRAAGATACVFAALAGVWSPAHAQVQSLYSNQSNPAIGMNALFSGTAAPGLNEAYGLGFDEAEMSLVSVVDPYWTLSGNIVFAADEVVPEEVWARTTSIPSIQLKLGRLRGSFGKHGLLHTHAFPFVQAPLIMANSIGDEGFKDGGVEAAWLTPLPWYAELTGGLYQAMEAGDGNPLDFASTAHDNLPFLGHLKNLVELSDATTLEVGQSWLQGRGMDGRVHSVAGADLTIRNVPLRNSNRRGWILESEYIQKGSRDGGGYIREQDGWYAALRCRLSQLWWTGVRIDQARDSFADFLVDDAGDPMAGRLTRGSVNLAWAPSEFSFVRLEYSHTEADAGAGRTPSDDRIMIQMSYTIGHHPAHAY